MSNENYTKNYAKETRQLPPARLLLLANNVMHLVGNFPSLSPDPQSFPVLQKSIVKIQGTQQESKQDGRRGGGERKRVKKEGICVH